MKNLTSLALFLFLGTLNVRSDILPPDSTHGRDYMRVYFDPLVPLTIYEFCSFSVFDMPIPENPISCDIDGLHQKYICYYQQSHDLMNSYFVRMRKSGPPIRVLSAVRYTN